MIKGVDFWRWKITKEGAREKPVSKERFLKADPSCTGIPLRETPRNNPKFA
jgi:hypothetical protein